MRAGHGLAVAGEPFVPAAAMPAGGGACDMRLSEGARRDGVMRLAFKLAILFLAGLYTAIGLAQLNFLSALGRIGPGFFPRILGLMLIATCLYSLYHDARQARDGAAISPFWRVVAVVALLSGLFVLALDILGGLLSMIVFMLASLTFLDPRRPVVNVAVALLLPICVYVLFDRYLNAAVPDGLVRLPF